MRFDDKTVLVTGGSRGIGRAIGQAFAASGAKVMLTSRKIDALEEAAAEIRESTGNGAVEVIASNAGGIEEPERVLSETVSRFGGLDVLVNNAATNPYFGPLMGLDASRADKIVEVNLRAVLLWSQAAVRLGFQGGQRGSIINIASIGGLSIEPGIGYYNVSKAGVIHLTRQLANELGPQVRVNAIAPGLVRTFFARALWEENEERVSARLPMGRIGEPSDIAGAALFLASDLASWITGEVLVVDGGALVASSR